MTNFKHEILSIILLAGMVALTIVAFITSGATAIAANCLIITIVTTFTYLLITFLQDKTHLYNIPYNIPHDKKQHIYPIVANLIITIKKLIVLLMAALTVTIYLNFHTLIYIASATITLLIIIASLHCHKKIKKEMHKW